jgi:hypothetical protein
MATASSTPSRTGSALVLLGSDLIGIRDVQVVLRLAASTASSSLLLLVCLLTLLATSLRVGDSFTGEPRTPDEAVGLGRWRRASGAISSRTMGWAMRRVRARAAGIRRGKGESRHERGKWRISLVVNATTGCLALGLVGIKVLDEVPEVHIVVWVWVLVWTHFGVLLISSRMMLKKVESSRRKSRVVK